MMADFRCRILSFKHKNNWEVVKEFVSSGAEIIDDQKIAGKNIFICGNRFLIFANTPLLNISNNWNAVK